MGSELKIIFDPQPVTLTGNLVRLEPMEFGACCGSVCGGRGGFDMAIRGASRLSQYC